MDKLISSLKQITIFQIFTISLRYLLGGSFVYASIFKIEGIRFAPESGESAPINSLAHFLETMYQANLYWSFIGWGQLTIGFLMMSQTFSTVGAVAFLPMILNILIITVSFGSNNILIITSLMLLGNIYLLFWDWSKLKFIILPSAKRYVDDSPSFSKYPIWSWLGIGLFFIIIILRKLAVSNL